MNDDYLMDTPTDAATVLEQPADEGQAEPAVQAETVTPAQDLAGELAKANAQYKSLQGQYDSFKRERGEFDKTRDETAQLRESHTVMQAQLADMRTLMAGKQVAAEEPLFDETLKGFLGEQSQGFEAALNRAAGNAAAKVRAESEVKIAELRVQLERVQKESQAVPFDVLRNSDPVYSEPGFQTFLETEKDPIFGLSIKEQMQQMHAQGRDVIPAVTRARNAYVAKKAAPAAEQEQPVSPRVTSAGSMAAKAPTSKVDIKALRAEYDGYAKANLAKDRGRRLEIMRVLAQHGSI